MSLIVRMTCGRHLLSPWHARREGVTNGNSNSDNDPVCVAARSSSISENEGQGRSSINGSFMSYSLSVTVSPLLRSRRILPGFE